MNKTNINKKQEEQKQNFSTSLQTNILDSANSIHC